MNGMWAAICVVWLLPAAALLSRTTTGIGFWYSVVIAGVATYCFKLIGG